MLFGGIDPGTTGAIAFYDPSTGFLEALDIPTFEIVVNRKKRARIDIPSTLAALSDHGDDQVALVVLEGVHARLGDNAATAFGLGEAFGTLRACLAASSLPYELVTPQAWKKAFGLHGKTATGADGRTSTGEGDNARALACQMFPASAAMFSRKKDHNRAEAALMALYAYRRHSGQIGESKA